jgi:hypothetical protein
MAALPDHSKMSGIVTDASRLFETFSNLVAEKLALLGYRLIDLRKVRTHRKHRLSDASASQLFALIGDLFIALLQIRTDRVLPPHQVYLQFNL